MYESFFLLLLLPCICVPVCASVWLMMLATIAPTPSVRTRISRACIAQRGSQKCSAIALWNVRLSLGKMSPRGSTSTSDCANAAQNTMGRETVGGKFHWRGSVRLFLQLFFFSRSYRLLHAWVATGECKDSGFMCQKCWCHSAASYQSRQINKWWSTVSGRDQIWFLKSMIFLSVVFHWISSLFGHLRDGVSRRISVWDPPVFVGLFPLLSNSHEVLWKIMLMYYSKNKENKKAKCQHTVNTQP